MADSNKQQEFTDFWDDVAGKPKSTIDPTVAKEIQIGFDEKPHPNLMKESSQN